MNEQIDKQAVEEMAKDIGEIQNKGMKCTVCDTGCDCRMFAEALYNASYRRQSEDNLKYSKDPLEYEGEWIAKEVMTRTPNANNYTCSACGCENAKTTPYCPNCGAKMKGGKG